MSPQASPRMNQQLNHRSLLFNVQPSPLLNNVKVKDAALNFEGVFFSGFQEQHVFNFPLPVLGSPRGFLETP